MTEKRIDIIRHGPKQAGKHVTGTEADLDPSQVGAILAYADNYAGITTGPIEVCTPTVPRNLHTAEHIHDELGDRVSKELVIDDRLSAFVDSCNLLPPALPRIWGEAEKAYQDRKGVRKEDRGMYAWAEIGLDQGSDGITLREVAYRIGSFILDKLHSPTPNIIGISHSGFIEPFIYATLDMMDPAPKTPVEYFHQTGGAIEPLKGVCVYADVDRTVLVLPDQTERTLDLDILRRQRSWLHDHGKAEDILRYRQK
jgi:hypothetical protein